MIKLKRMNAVALMVSDLERSMDWYRQHFGFEYAHDAEGCIVMRTGDIELVLAQHEDPKAPLADPNLVRCIHTLAFEISEAEFTKVHAEFANDDGIVNIDQSKFRSIITEDPDGYCVELYFNKDTQQKASGSA